MGLLGKNISYSFSRGYFTEKFAKEELSDHGYVNFDIQSIDEFPSVIREFKNHLKGLNVTIPYKQDIFSFLDDNWLQKLIKTIAESIAHKSVDPRNRRSIKSCCICFKKYGHCIFKSI